MDLDLNWCTVCGARIPLASNASCEPDAIADNSLYCSRDCREKDSSCSVSRVVDAAQSIAFCRPPSTCSFLSSSVSSSASSFYGSPPSPNYPFLSPTVKGYTGYYSSSSSSSSPAMVNFSLPPSSYSRKSSSASVRSTGSTPPAFISAPKPTTTTSTVTTTGRSYQ